MVEKSIRHYSWFSGARQEVNILPLSDGVAIQPRFAVIDVFSLKGEKTSLPYRRLVRSQISKEKAISFAETRRLCWRKDRQKLIDEYGYLDKAAVLRVSVKKDTSGIPHHSFAFKRLRKLGNIKWGVKRGKEETPNLLFLAGWSEEGDWMVSFDIKARIDEKNTTAGILNKAEFSGEISIPDHDLYQPPTAPFEYIAVAALFKPGQNITVMTKSPGSKLRHMIYQWNGKDLLCDFIRIWSIDWA